MKPNGKVMSPVRSYSIFVFITLLAVAFPISRYHLQEHDKTHQLQRGWSFVYPDTTAVVVHDNTFLLVIKVDTAEISSVKIYAPWDSSISIDLAPVTAAETTRRKIASAVPPDLLLREITTRITPYHQPVDTVTDTFEFSQKVTAREFLLNDTLGSTTKALRKKNGLFANLHIVGWKPITIQITRERSHYCRGEYIAVPLFLLPGLNPIPTEVFRSKKQVTGLSSKLSTETPYAELDSVLAFYQLEVDGISPPPYFQTRGFHTTGKKALCAKCHTMQSEGGAADLKCESCHGAMESQKSVHMPVATNDCSTCHTSEPSSGYPATYSADTEAETCFTCHDSIGNDIKTKAAVHVPAAGGQCSLCHSPHASPNDSLLRKPINSLCITCHVEKKEGNHPVVFHPVGDRPNPRQPGTELSCVSCHSPHASENNFLLLASDGYFRLCQSCHEK